MSLELSFNNSNLSPGFNATLQIIAIFCKVYNFCGCRTLYSCDYFLLNEFRDGLLAILINVTVLANRLLKIVRLAIFAAAPNHGH